MGGSGAGPEIGLASASRISLALATATLSRVGGTQTQLTMELANRIACRGLM